MKILHVITSLRKAAGTTTFVENVVNGLIAKGHEAEIVMSSDGFCRCDLIHIHGLWSGLLHKASLFVKKNGIPVVWSTHGMTAPWSMRHKWWKKLPAWMFYQKRDLRSADAIHCTTEPEAEWNRRLGFKNCFIVPLGTDISRSEQVEHGDGKIKTILFVGRIYPVKGLVNFIRAWGEVVRNPGLNGHGWRLRIVGPDQAGHQAELERLVGELGLNDHVEFAGPKFGDDLGKEYENCDCLTLPSFTENFGATVVDAMAHGKPVITSEFTPWKEVRDRRCGWWVSNAPAHLAEAIREMIDIGDDGRRGMGLRGRKLVEEKYTWDAVVKAMVKEYEEVLKRRSRVMETMQISCGGNPG